EVAVVDCMPPRDENLQIVRLVEGRSGRVPMQMELAIRFDNGSIEPWVRTIDGDLLAIGGPDSLRLSTPVTVTGAGMTSVAAFSVLALLAAGYTEEASAWRDWLLRAVAGDPADLQIMYGLAGERRLQESALPWLPGYEGSAPVRVGNAAHQQFQLDVYGEVLDTLHQARRIGIEEDESAWALQRHLLDFLESRWKEPDEGIWEVRGPRRQFTHS